MKWNFTKTQKLETNRIVQYGLPTYCWNYIIIQFYSTQYNSECKLLNLYNYRSCREYPHDSVKSCKSTARIPIVWTSEHMFNNNNYGWNRNNLSSRQNTCERTSGIEVIKLRLVEHLIIASSKFTHMFIYAKNVWIWFVPNQNIYCFHFLKNSENNKCPRLEQINFNYMHC